MDLFNGALLEDEPTVMSDISEPQPLNMPLECKKSLANASSEELYDNNAQSADNASEQLHEHVIKHMNKHKNESVAASLPAAPCPSLIIKLRKRFDCRVCHKKFFTLRALHAHYQHHPAYLNRDENLFPFVCAVCHMRFKRNYDYLIHMRSHTGHRPYKCWPCNMRFTTLSNLRRHERSIKHSERMGNVE